MAVLLGVTLSKGTAAAHVFFTDGTKKSGVIMHITPDDDPIAGETANAYFDIQDQSLSTADHYYRLYITNEADMKTQAATYATGKQTVTSSYVFPSQGTYLLELTAFPRYEASKSERKPTTFAFTQRVNRGRISSPLDQPRYAWAEFGILAALAASGAVIYTILVRRRQIAAYTTWK